MAAANEGGTHGLCERMRIDGEFRRRTPMNAGIEGNLTGRQGLFGLRLRGGGSRALKKAAHRFSAVPLGTTELVEQFIGRPRRLAACVPF